MNGDKVVERDKILQVMEKYRDYFKEWNADVAFGVYNVPIDVDMNFDPNPILWTLENTLIPIRGHQTVPLL